MTRRKSLTTQEISVEEYRALANGNYPAKVGKYRAVKTTIDGITFDSKAESYRYLTLKKRRDNGLIRDLKMQPEFPLKVEGCDCGKYIGDFAYTDAHGAYVVEDVKSPATKTPVYQLKRKLVRALYGIEIEEVHIDHRTGERIEPRQPRGKSGQRDVQRTATTRGAGKRTQRRKS